LQAQVRPGQWVFAAALRRVPGAAQHERSEWVRC